MDTRKYKNLFSVLALVATGIYPVVFMYLHNIAEVSMDQLFAPLLMPLAMGLGLCILSLIYSKNIQIASLTGILFLLFFWNYEFIEQFMLKIYFGFYFWHIAAMALFSLTVINMALKGQKDAYENLLKINLVIGAVFAGLIIFNIVVSIPDIGRKISFAVSSGHSQLAEEQNIPEESSKSKLPNIYYIIPDEYSNFDMMEKYYNYDNEEFRQFLLGHSFNISNSSFNVSPSTLETLPNILNYDYVTTESSSSFERMSKMREASIFPKLKEYGYNNYVIDTWRKVTLNAKTISRRETADDRSFMIMCLEKTFLKYFLEAALASRVIGHRERILSAFEDLEISISLSTWPNFIFCHIMSPHAPFFADEDGNLIEARQAWNEDERSIYLGQFKYITEKLKRIINQIILEDPASIVILQSDHGMRGTIAMKPFVSYDDSRKIINAVYFKGEKLDIEGLCGVNTLRLIMNRVLGMELNMLDGESIFFDEVE